MLFALMLLSALALTLLLDQPIARAATATIPATEGQQFSQTVASAHYDCSGQPTSEQATIAWGDATTSSGTVTVSGSELQIAGAHTYAEEGAFSGSISGSYTCAVGAGPIQFTTGFDAQVADAALTATAQTVSAVAGQAFSVTVVTFADADPGAAAGDFTAAVDWEDGTPPSAGTITAAPAGGFAVGASHTYATAGSYAVTVTVSDAGGASARATTTATATAPQTSGGLTLNLAPGARFDGTVATTTSQCLASQLTSGVTATINWGDDHSSPARALISGGTLQFAGSHVYAVAGNYTGSVTGSYHCGQQVLQVGSLGFGGVVALVNVVELRAQGMDVTQGIVNDGNLNPSGVLRGGSANFSGLTWSPPDTGGDKLPGPTLASENWTVVRLYADAHGATGAGLPGVGAQLYGYRNGQPLAGSPLTPDYGPASLPDTGEADPAPVYTAERTSDANAFTFTLPQSWTDAGTITLVGRLTPPPPSTNGLFKTVTCATAGCNADESYSLANVSFVLLPYVVIAPVAMVQPSEPALPDPYSLYWNALRTEPNATGYIVLPYVATVDPTQVIDDPTAYDPKGDLNSGYLQLLEWFAGWYYYGVPGAHLPNIITAVNEDQRGVTVNSIYNYPSPAFDVVNISRPLTSVAHELGHALGRNHADDSAASGKADGTGSTGCGGGGGPWPPDGLGYMQGIGLDRSTSPYRVLYPGLPGEPSQWYDKMSYCVNTDESSQGGNVPDTWTSPFGWLHSISALYVFGKATGRIVHAVRGRAAPDRTPPDRAHGAASRGRGLFVTAVSDSAGTKIVGVVPSTGGAPTPPQTGGFTLVARNGAGQTVATGSLYAQQVHDDPGPTYTDMFGTVPAAGAASVAIVHDGTVIATRVRPPHPPR
ncbi:MAG: PKD domain-containing protein, partial [Solirubrobacteraceae bacterium]